MFITMGVAAHSEPLFSAYTASAGYSVNPDLVTPDAAGKFPPVQHSSGLPDSSNFGASINGLMNAVYAYGGSQIFLDFMAEMRQPRDFLKSMWGSQLFIYLCYMLYGLFMYGYQGQYVQNPSYLGISPYNWSTAGNALAMITAVIAAALYGNIGLKGKYP
jgi:amino acid transporter